MEGHAAPAPEPGHLGQLAFLIRANYRIETTTYAKVQGLPFTPSEIEEKADEILKSL